MLVLTIKEMDGPIHLRDKTTGEHIKISLIESPRGSARLGFDASDNIEVLRDKLWRAQND